MRRRLATGSAGDVVPAPASAPANVFDGVQVFTASVALQREELGERVCAWLALHPELEIVDITVRQSSDSGYHCLTMCVFFLDRVPAVAKSPRIRR